MRNNNHLSS